MSELTLTLIKLGFLAVLWLFVLSAVSVIRSDVFGTKAPAAAPRPKSKPKSKEKAPSQPKSRKPSRGVPTKLQVVSGPNAGQSVPLSDQPILLGRGTDASIRLDDDYVSTRHARFATNGVILDGQPVDSSQVRDGSEIRLGNTVIIVRITPKATPHQQSENP